VERGTVRVAGDVELAWRAWGDGPPLVCLPGWSQAASTFEGVATILGESRRVIALDHRGQGDSSHPAGGYRIHRLGADLHQALDALGLETVTLLGHSMGNAVLWAYLELFGTERVDRLVFADQRPTLLRDPAWSDDESRRFGGTQTFEQLLDLTAQLRDPATGWDTTAAVLRNMVSADLPDERFEALLETNRSTSDHVRAELWFSQCTLDWRDLFPVLDVPTLVVHGEASMIPTECQRWIADKLPHGELALIPDGRGGSHFAYWEDPEAFTDPVRAWMS
jgi:non-heme chloroperoxidase